MTLFETSAQGQLQILSVSGRLEPMDGKELRAMMDSLAGFEDGSSLLVDLEHLEYMASAGFRELFMAGRKLGRCGGKLAVCALRGEVKRVFELAKFDTAYPIYATREEAVVAMGPSVDS